MFASSGKPFAGAVAGRRPSGRQLPFFSRWVAETRGARAFGRQPTAPKMVLFAAVITLLTAVYLVLAIMAPADAPSAKEFGERGAVTVLSAIFLTMAGAFSISTFVVEARANGRGSPIWFFMACGFIFFSFDELMKFHERAGRFAEQFIDPGIFRSLNDVIVVLYGLVGLLVLLACLPAILRFRYVIEAYAIAVVFFVVHTLVDMTNEPITTLSMICEESAKLFCGSFLAMGSFAALIGAIWRWIPGADGHGTSGPPFDTG